MFPFWTLQGTVVVSKFMGPSVQITAHIITLNEVTVQIVEVHWEVISKNWPPLSQPVWSEGLNAETSQAIDNNTLTPLWLWRCTQDDRCPLSLQTATFCPYTVHWGNIPLFSSCCCMFLFLFCLHILKCWVVLAIDTYFYTFTFPNDTSIYNLLA